MSWCVRAVGVLCLGGALVLSGLADPRIFASEPFGRVLLQAAWLDAEAGNAGPDAQRLLRLELKPITALDDVELTVTSPPSFGIKATDPAWDSRFRTVAAGEGRRAIRAGLERLEPSKSVLVELEVVVPPLDGGIISLEVAGVDATGRRVHEALGLSVPGAKSPGKARLGAVEFPAAVRDGKRR